MPKRVVITGSSLVSALGHDWPSVKARLISQTNCVRYMPEWEHYADLTPRIASPVDDFVLPAFFKAKARRSMGRVAEMAVTATYHALEQAGLRDDALLTSGQMGVAYGSATGSSDAAMEFFSLLRDNTTAKMNATTYLRMMSHTAAVNISVLFKTCGRMITTSTACTGGSQAIGYAFEAIAEGKQIAMIAGGAEALCPTQVGVFDTVYAASTNSEARSTPRPFDAARDGLVLGEGAGTLILEERDHALARGAKILGEVVGFATNTDGKHLVKPNQQTMQQVMRDALDSANLAADDIGYISAHGTATVQGDIAESCATAEVFTKPCPISSLKSYIGHSLGACGAIEAFVALNMMQEKWLHPCLNLTSLGEKVAELDYIRGEPRTFDREFVMSNNFAFGGVNTSLIFKTA